MTGGARTRKGSALCQGAGWDLSWPCGAAWRLAPPSRGIPLLPKSQPSPALLPAEAPRAEATSLGWQLPLHTPSSAVLSQVSDPPRDRAPERGKGLTAQSCRRLQALPALGPEPPGLWLSCQLGLAPSPPPGLGLLASAPPCLASLSPCPHLSPPVPYFLLLPSFSCPVVSQSFSL